jgi:ATP-dependent DNA helicase PIF1
MRVADESGGSVMSNIQVNEEWQAAIAAVEEGNNVYITGAAGTGKSTLLHYVRSRTSKAHAVVAPTGVAALNVGGQTIHSFFKFPPWHIDPITIRGNCSDLFQRLQLLIIDEISMVRADLMDAIDIFLQKSRRTAAPFGGVQLVLFGDLYQLPPVVDSNELHVYLTEKYGGRYFFQANAFDHFQPKRIALVNNYRQKDHAFLDVLWKVRTGKPDEADIAALNDRYVPVSPDDETYVHLTSTKIAARQRNALFLDRIKSELHISRARIAGKFSESVYPTDVLLKLKIGAKVMMVKNDRYGRWVNGTIGRIAGFGKDSIDVDIDGQTHTVARENWEKTRYLYNRSEGRVIHEVVGTFVQYPVCLAWAITIHKAQGHTLNKICIDLGQKAFDHGQAYVALSRCTSLDGIVLRRPITMDDIIVDPIIAAHEQAASQVHAHEPCVAENAITPIFSEGVVPDAA